MYNAELSISVMQLQLSNAVGEALMNMLTAGRDGRSKEGGVR